MKKDFLVTYKFWTRKGRRLSIFGVYNSDFNMLSIIIIKCSNEDKFSKKEANRLFNDYMSYKEGDEVVEVHPTVVNIPCDYIDSRKTFIQYCNTNYYKMFYSAMYCNNLGIEIGTLVKKGINGSKGEVLIVPSTIHTIKAIQLPIDLTTGESIKGDDNYSDDNYLMGGQLN